MWKLKIKQYFQVQDYALWDVIENGNSFNQIPRITTNADGTSTSIISCPVTTEEKAQEKNNKIVSQLAIMGENISQEDLNIKFLRSLPAKWNTHVVFWRNKPDLETMSFDDLYNNFKIVKHEVKRMITSSSSSGSQNMAFLSTPGNTNKVYTTTIQVSTVSIQVSTVSAHDNTVNLSDATVYDFLANQPNGSQLVHEDLEQIHEDDMEKIDLKWQLALLSIRARRSPRSQESRRRNQDSSRKTVIVEDTSFKVMVVIDEAGFDWSYMADDEISTNMALMAFSDSENQTWLLRCSSVQFDSWFRGTDLYSITLQDTSTPNPICLVAKATSSQSWLWHHNCSFCELGKAKRKSFKTKTTPSSKRRLQILHMDLCGPMRVESFNSKKYVLVIDDEYSKYIWTHILRSQDETPKVLIEFLKLVQRGLHAQVRTARTDKDTNFLNKTLHAYFAQEGIEHQTSTAQTP
nr:hypothetical protein [Tanacetum cinerariifolium]